MDFRIDSGGQLNSAVSSAKPLEKWYERLGHVNYKTLKQMAANGGVIGMAVDEDKNNSANVDRFCEAYALGKLCRQPYDESEARAKVCGELIHFDIVGPIQEESIAGAKWLVVFADDHSGYLVVRTIQSKSDVVEVMASVLVMFKNNENDVKRVTSENASEFIGKKMKAVMSKFNVGYETSITYCPQQNGRAERQNRTVVEMARKMLAARDLPLSLWA